MSKYLILDGDCVVDSADSLRRAEQIAQRVRDDFRRHQLGLGEPPEFGGELCVAEVVLRYRVADVAQPDGSTTQDLCEWRLR